MLLAIVEWAGSEEWIDGNDLLLLLVMSAVFFPKFFLLIDWIMFCMSLILFSTLLSLFLTVHSRNKLHSFFTEEVGSDFWEVVGLLDKLLVLFGLIVFLGEDGVAIFA